MGVILHMARPLKLHRKVKSLLLAIAFGLGLPAAFGFLALEACPEPAGMFDLPVICSSCPGEFIGELGFLITAFSGVCVMIASMLIGSASLEVHGYVPTVFDRLTPDMQLTLLIGLGALANVLAYWPWCDLYLRRRKQRPPTKE